NVTGVQTCALPIWGRRVRAPGRGTADHSRRRDEQPVRGPSERRDGLLTTPSTPCSRLGWPGTPTSKEATMTWTVKGVVARSEKQPAELLDIIIPDPGPNDVVVDIEATGVCHTDLAYRDGDINDEFPFLLGHESAGRFAGIGECGSDVVVVDYVVLNWRAVFGQRRACKKGVQQYCLYTHTASKPMSLTVGIELTAALGIGSFAAMTLVHEGQ